MAKTFLKDGKWIDNPDAPKVVLCSCANKYIKTRKDQTTCLRCFGKKIAERRSLGADRR